MSFLTLEGLTRQWDGQGGVRDISVSLSMGAFLSILGPSGCGKTTLMRMIAGFETPSSGDIRIKGESVLSIPPNRRNVKMVFQNLALFPMMSVGENIAYGLRCRGDVRSEIAGKVARVLDRVSMPGVEDKQIDQLSGGQKQRIAIARCMVLEPDVLLLDEPLGALDLKLREHMKIELKQLQHRFATTFLYITHDQSEALVMSDQVAVMNAGRFEQIGTPKELYRGPVSGFVAGFVGDATCLPGTITDIRGQQARVALDSGGQVIGCLCDESGTGDAVEVFLRPEAMQICSGNDDTTLRGRVDSLLFNGANSRVLMRMGSGQIIEVAETAQADPLTEGAQIAVSWRPEQARIFARRAE